MLPEMAPPSPPAKVPSAVPFKDSVQVSLPFMNGCCPVITPLTGPPAGGKVRVRLGLKGSSPLEIVPLPVIVCPWQAARVAAAGSRVAVGAGSGVGVGRGTLMVCPICRFVQLLFKLFKLMMADAEEPYRLAMEMHESPLLTTYSIGGSVVSVGVSVGTRVSVGVGVIVTVSVGLGTIVIFGSPSVPFNVINDTSAPITRKTAKRPSAIGRLRVTFGMCAPWTVSSDSAFGLGMALNSLPHTTQREAFSDSRVPQVGQSFVGFVSGVIIRGL